MCERVLEIYSRIAKITDRFAIMNQEEFDNAEQELIRLEEELEVLEGQSLVDLLVESYISFSSKGKQYDAEPRSSKAPRSC